MKRRLAFFLISFLLTFGLATPVAAYTITGGTATQQATVRDTIDAAQFPPVSWVESQLGEVTVVIGQGGSTSVHRRIHIDESATIYFSEAVAHEWSHQVWFALPQAARDEWTALATADMPDYDPAIWRQTPVENHAENLRVAAWSSDYYVTLAARTDLKHFQASFVRAWHLKWINPSTITTTTAPPPTTTTTTVLRGDPFPDITREDAELWAAAWWGLGIFRGYEDGTFGPYDPMTRHQIALVADRWKGFAFTAFLADWTPATRADVCDALPGLRWKEDRWNETITRSQTLRLLYRTQ